MEHLGVVLKDLIYKAWLIHYLNTLGVVLYFKSMNTLQLASHTALL